jgi:hypothetical protein
MNQSMIDILQKHGLLEPLIRQIPESLFNEAAEPRIQEYIQKVKLEAMLEGELEAKADDIIRFLKKRFDKSPPTNKLQEQIRDVRSIEKLDELFDFAITCNSIDEFVSVL